jgi:hypothetical protein
VFRVPVTAPGFDSWVVLADFLERYKARFDIELPEMTAMLANLRTTIIGRRSPVDLAIFAPAIDGSGAARPSAAGALQRRLVRYLALRPGFFRQRREAHRACDRGGSRIRRWSSTPAQPPSSTAWAIW